MNMIFLVKGHAHLGMNKYDKDGNVTESTPAHFEFAPDGPCVAVGEMNPVTYEINSDSLSIFGDWDAAGYMVKALEMLKPRRSVNIPDFEAIIKAAYKKDGNDIVCDYCNGLNCRDCIVKEWKDEAENDS